MDPEVPGSNPGGGPTPPSTPLLATEPPPLQPRSPCQPRAPRELALSSTQVLVVRGLVKRYGRIYGARRVDLTVQRGVHGLVGPNGAGKTTTMKCIVGLAVPDAGEALFLGERLWGPGGWRLRSLIGYVPETPDIRYHGTARELLEELAVAEGYSRAEAREAARRAAEETGVEDLLDKKVSALSKGQRKRILYTQALLAPRELLVLDEPFSGLDPEAVVWARTLIAEKSRESAVLVSTHLLREIENLATRVTVIIRGETVYEGPVEELVRKTLGVKLVVEVSDPDKAARVLESVGAEVARRLGSRVEAVARDREHVADIVEALVANGVRVYSVQVLHGLEDAYIKLLEERRGGGGA